MHHIDAVLSTGNPSKGLQVAALFANSPVTIHTLADLGIKGNAVEDGMTLAENALKKARFARKALEGPLWALADDTGLFISALGGEPGIHAARWGGAHLSTPERMRYCLARLSRIVNRRAVFLTIVALVSPRGVEHTFKGKVKGSLLLAPRVEPQPGMPYSSLFVPDGETLSLAEMPLECENALSHRGKAFRKARTFLELLSTVGEK